MQDPVYEALDCMAVDNPVLLIGPPGCGKTARVEQWADANGRRLLVEHPVIAQSVDYRGLPAVVDGQANWLPIGGLREITEPDGPPTVVFLDDLGQAPSGVQAAVMQLLWARKLGDAKVRDNVLFCAATNRVEDRAGVRPMLSALVGRCQVVQVSLSPKAWADWAIRQDDIASLVAAYARFRVDCFVNKVPEIPMQPFCTPRTLTAAGRLVAKGVKKIDLLAGWIGAGPAADLMAYAEVVDKLPTLQSLFVEPDQVKKIKDPGLLHAITVMVARAAMEEPEGVVKLATALGGGWGVALISDACAFDTQFKKSAEFKQWAVNHKEVL